MDHTHINKNRNSKDVLIVAGLNGNHRLTEIHYGFKGDTGKQEINRRSGIQAVFGRIAGGRSNII